MNPRSTSLADADITGIRSATVARLEDVEVLEPVFESDRPDGEIEYRVTTVLRRFGTIGRYAIGPTVGTVSDDTYE